MMKLQQHSTWRIQSYYFACEAKRLILSVVLGHNVQVQLTSCMWCLSGTLASVDQQMLLEGLSASELKRTASKAKTNLIKIKCNSRFTDCTFFDLIW
ncbi:hypothetical protein LOK49_LG08G03165 [Camellia lanceoleosa]|uniref:Uncharacterized protein n=1 Tax=Camellia lanceoleosa TaxID=1840588 RepID=A0ACC0GW31_9ERIC|nr:hypothetical protein LOK49_LG08G03165 [Camellia lanceoleosa]